MPNNFDFSTLKNIKTIEVTPAGWVTPLVIEYGIKEESPTFGELNSYHWRVKGTRHTFVIPVIRMDFLSSGDYKKHFENALENFRQDYINWKDQGFITEWAREYEQQFSRFIIV